MTCEVCGEVGHLGKTALRHVKMPHISTIGSDNKVITTGGTISPTHMEIIQTSI
jgi:hypothetical protein